MSQTLWRYSLAGLLVLVPAWVTVLILSALVRALNELIHDLPWNIGDRLLPGLSLVVLLLLIVIVGAIATHVVGRRIIIHAERWIERVPLVRSVYITLKGMTDLLNFRFRFGRRTRGGVPFPAAAAAPWWPFHFLETAYGRSVLSWVSRRRHCKSRQQQVYSWSLCPRRSIRSPAFLRLFLNHSCGRSICCRKTPSKWSALPVCTSRTPDGCKTRRQGSETPCQSMTT